MAAWDETKWLDAKIKRKSLNLAWKCFWPLFAKEIKPTDDVFVNAGLAGVQWLYRFCDLLLLTRYISVWFIGNWIKNESRKNLMVFDRYLKKNILDKMKEGGVGRLSHQNLAIDWYEMVFSVYLIKHNWLVSMHSAVCWLNNDKSRQ